MKIGVNYKSYSYAELLAYLSITDVIVCPYKSATQSGVISLSLGFGLPVVTTSVGGLPEMVNSGMTGEVVPSAAPKYIAEAILKILSAESYPNYRKAALNFARDVLSPDKAARKILEVVKEVSK